MKQPHYEFTVIKAFFSSFLYGMKQCRNYIVRACLTNAIHNARTLHNLAFFKNKHGIDI